MTRMFATLAPIALLLGISPAFAAETQDLDRLERRLVIALGADIGAPGGPATPIDRRMKLASCPSDVAIEPAVMGAAVLRCTEIGWRIRVPLVRGGTAKAGAAAPAAPEAKPVEKLAPVIRRGDPVEIALSRGGFSVSTEAVAEQDGAPGDRIRVRQDRRAAPMMVEVVDFGKTRIPGFN